MPEAPVPGAGGRVDAAGRTQTPDRAPHPGWDQPGVELITRGVHRAPLPLPGDSLQSVNVYILDDGDGVTLIDAGWALDGARGALDDALSSLGYGLGDIRRFLITHIHRDHYTLAIAVRRLFGTQVFLGIGEKPSLSKLRSAGWRHSDASVPELRRAGAAALADEVKRADTTESDLARTWELPDEWIPGSSEIPVAGTRLTAISTPGHTRGHLVFVDLDRKMMFSGDHILPHITPSLGHEPARAELPLGDYLASLVKVRSLPDLQLLPAHGPAGGSTHHRIDALLSHHEQRLMAAHRAVGGAATAFQVAARLRWTRRAHRLDDLDRFNRSLAVLETLTHLDLLVHQHRLAATIEGGVTIYSSIDEAALG